VWTVAVVLVVVVFRRVLMWAAKKGWIYYGDVNRPRFSPGNALSMFQPEIEHVVEQEQWGYVEDVDDEAGAGDH